MGSICVKEDRVIEYLNFNFLATYSFTNSLRTRSKVDFFKTNYKAFRSELDLFHNIEKEKKRILLRRSVTEMVTILCFSIA